MTALPPPDPQLGVFETMLVHGGRPIELDAHFERLTASLEALFGGGIPSGARELVLEQARGIDLGRLRLTVAPNDGGDLRAKVATAAVQPALVFPAPELAIALRSHVVDGGLGAHKWADRRLLEAAEAAAAAGSVPLVTDRSSDVLEASRANVFLVRDGALITPPADGRILPGIARRHAIEVAGEAGIEVREEAVALDRLAQADEVFLTGSVRGVEPAASLDGADLASGGEISERIAAGLRRRWLDASRAGIRSSAAQPRHHPVGPLGEAAQALVSRRDLDLRRGGPGRSPVGEHCRAGPLGKLGRATRLLGGVDRRRADRHHRGLGSAGGDDRLVDPLAPARSAAAAGALGQDPVLRVVALGILHGL